MAGFQLLEFPVSVFEQKRGAPDRRSALADGEPEMCAHGFPFPLTICPNAKF